MFYKIFIKYNRQVLNNFLFFSIHFFQHRVTFRRQCKYVTMNDTTFLDNTITCLFSKTIQRKLTFLIITNGCRMYSNYN